MVSDRQYCQCIGFAPGRHPGP
ncbi:hypothetical protein YPPY47_0245, partial [Yersinia pestis PY-47]